MNEINSTDVALPDGSVPVAGTDFVQVTADGQIRGIVGFFGPLAPKT